MDSETFCWLFCGLLLVVLWNWKWPRALTFGNDRFTYNSLELVDEFQINWPVKTLSLTKVSVCRCSDPSSSDWDGNLVMGKIYSWTVVEPRRPMWAARQRPYNTFHRYRGLRGQNTNADRLPGTSLGWGWRCDIPYVRVTWSRLCENVSFVSSRWNAHVVFFWFILFDQRQWWIELVKVDGFLVTCSLQNSFFSSGFLCGKALTLPPTHWLRDFSDRWRPMGVDCIEFSGAMGWMKSEDSVIYAHNVITKTCWYLGYSRT